GSRTSSNRCNTSSSSRVPEGCPVDPSSRFNASTRSCSEQESIRTIPATLIGPAWRLCSIYYEQPHEATIFRGFIEFILGRNLAHNEVEHGNDKFPSGLR